MFLRIASLSSSFFTIFLLGLVVVVGAVVVAVADSSAGRSSFSPGHVLTIGNLVSMLASFIAGLVIELVSPASAHCDWVR